MTYELCELINISKLQKLLDDFYIATDIPTEIISKNGTILTSTHWESIHTEFYKSHPKKDLIDLSVPIIVENTFLATIFTGQISHNKSDNQDHYKKILQFLKSLTEMISEMCLKELKLLEAEKRYKFALHGSNDGMWNWDYVNNFFDASTRFLDILGYSIKEFNNLLPHLKDIIHPSCKKYILQSYYNHINHKTKHFNEKLFVKTKDGNYKYISLRGSCNYNKQGKKLNITGFITDLSKTKTAEEELKIEKSCSKTLMDNSNLIICTWNKDTYLTYLNKYGQSILGYTPTDFPTRNWVSIIPRKVCKVFLSYIHSSKPKIHIPLKETCMKCKNGTTITVIWNIEIIKSQDGTIQNIIGMGVDITYKTKIENELTEFFGNVSHELKTPLNLIFSSIQLTDLYFNNNIVSENIDKLNNLRKTMKQNCYRLLKLVNNILDITKIDSGYMTLDIKECDIVNLITEIMFSIVHYYENKNLTISFNTDMNEIFIQCDPDKIERILLNLLSNSIKYTNPGGHISVNLTTEEKNIIFSIKDNGIGIRQDQQEIIFNCFTQVNKSFTRDQEGSGIGLSIVKSLVEMHKGSIKLISDYGHGSEFIIKLPITNSEYKPIDNNSKNLLYTDSSNKMENIHIEFSDI